jgi:hypothetical protein
MKDSAYNSYNTGITSAGDESIIKPIPELLSTVLVENNFIIFKLKIVAIVRDTGIGLIPTPLCTHCDDSGPSR